MQIIIVQTEIEDAIRNHILNQINIKDDQRIDIDLRATRGSDGFQAVIDIVADSTPQRTIQAQPAEDKPTETSVQAPTKPVTKAKAVKATAPAAVKEAVQATSTEEDVIIPDDEVVSTGSTFDTESSTEQGDDESIADQAAEEAPPAKKTSLFANMKKPENA